MNTLHIITKYFPFFVSTLIKHLNYENMRESFFVCQLSYDVTYSEKTLDALLLLLYLFYVLEEMPHLISVRLA